MCQKEKINWLKVLLYSIAVFVSTVVVSATLTFGSLNLGYDVEANYQSFQLSIYSLTVPIAYFFYFMLAKSQLYRPYLHNGMVFLLVLVLSSVPEYFLLGYVASWLLWVIEIPLFLFALYFATQHGIKYQKRKDLMGNAT